MILMGPFKLRIFNDSKSRKAMVMIIATDPTLAFRPGDEVSSVCPYTHCLQISVCFKAHLDKQDSKFISISQAKFTAVL